MKPKTIRSISDIQSRSSPSLGKSLAALTLSLYGCAVPVADPIDGPGSKTLILNGYEGSSENFPAIGAYVDDGGMDAICTVSFIRKDLALTAAHCISPDGSETNGLGYYDPEYVLHGRNETFNEYCEEGDPCNKYLHHVVAATRHPKYDDYADTENHHDFALLLLEREIADAEPIELLPNTLFEEALAIGDTVTIAGYGRHYDDYDSFWKIT
ncbi:MAG: trypsin-like serine protease, partial [Nanoarchaeota archaeon]